VCEQRAQGCYLTVERPAVGPALDCKSTALLYSMHVVRCLSSLLSYQNIFVCLHICVIAILLIMLTVPPYYRYYYIDYQCVCKGRSISSRTNKPNSTNNIWRNCGQEYSVSFFDSRCIIEIISVYTGPFNKFLDYQPEQYNS